ncbi:MAG: DUF697 domain-containing protein [bacterium]|nr:DUF697 domain-containing protein [bacterium]
MDRTLQAEATISDHVLYAIGGAAIPLPLLDIAAVSAIQLNLVRDLSQIYDVEHDITAGRTLITSLVGASLPRLGASLVKLLPGAGWLAGTLTQVALSGATTYAVGHSFRTIFESGREISSVRVEEVRGMYDEFVAEGSRVTEQVREREREDTERRPRLRGIARALARLERMRDSGSITDLEFERLKAVALSHV